jgi:hypothetical protein
MTVTSPSARGAILLVCLSAALVGAAVAFGACSDQSSGGAPICSTTSTTASDAGTGSSGGTGGTCVVYSPGPSGPAGGW